MLLVVGAVAMVADAVIVEEEWLEDEIYRLMDPISNNNPYLRDYFLSNMYRIVSYYHIFLIIRTREIRKHKIAKIGRFIKSTF